MDTPKLQTTAEQAIMWLLLPNRKQQLIRTKIAELAFLCKSFLKIYL